MSVDIFSAPTPKKLRTDNEHTLIMDDSAFPAIRKSDVATVCTLHAAGVQIFAPVGKNGIPVAWRDAVKTATHNKPNSLEMLWVLYRFGGSKYLKNFERFVMFDGVGLWAQVVLTAMGCVFTPAPKRWLLLVNYIPVDNVKLVFKKGGLQASKYTFAEILTALDSARKKKSPQMFNQLVAICMGWTVRRHSAYCSFNQSQVLTVLLLAARFSQ